MPLARMEPPPGRIALSAAGSRCVPKAQEHLERSDPSWNCAVAIVIDPMRRTNRRGALALSWSVTQEHQELTKRHAHSTLHFVRPTENGLERLLGRQRKKKHVHGRPASPKTQPSSNPSRP